MTRVRFRPSWDAGANGAPRGDGSHTPARRSGRAVTVEDGAVNALLDGAIGLLRFGFSVIPIQPNGKAPLVSWAVYQGASAVEEVVRSWWARWPDANVGVVTGAVSGIVVVDIDGEKGLASVKAAGLELPRTMCCTTGRGIHVYFKHPGWRVPNRAGVLPGVDVRGDGGFVVAPPSVHPSGRRYSWYKGCAPPHEVTLAELPARLCELLKGAPVVARGGASGAGFLEGVAEGERNNRAAALAGLFIAHGFTASQTATVLHLWNARNTPPLDDVEVNRVVRSIAARHARRVLE